MELGTLHREIDDLLAVDAGALSDGALHELVVGLQQESSRMAAVRAALLAVWEARRVWADDGSKSPAARLSREASVSERTAKLELRRARRLRSMPHTAGALADGGLSPDHVDMLGRLATGPGGAWFAEHEETLVEQCRVLLFADAEQMVAYWRQRADAEGVEDEAVRLRERRGLSASTTLDGTVDVRGLLDPVGGEAFREELHPLERLLFLQDERDGTVRTSHQRRADAVVLMAERSRTAAEGGLRPRPLITVLVGEATLAYLCELASGTVIAPGLIVPWLSDADLERVVFDGPDRVIGVSRKRSFTGAVRRAIEVRDRRCQHPSGCNVPASRCDVDHILPHGEGGITSQENGRMHCPTHNRNPELRNRRPRPPDPPDLPVATDDLGPPVTDRGDDPPDADAHAPPSAA